jgi:hypothetical protein
MKKRSKKILAVLLTAGLAASSSMPAWAEQTNNNETTNSTTTEGSGSETPSSAESSVTVSGNESKTVSSVENNTMTTGVSVQAGGGNVTVGGDIKIDGTESGNTSPAYGVVVNTTSGTGTVDVGGNISVDSEGKAQAEVIGIGTFAGADVDIGTNKDAAGNVTVSGEYGSYGIYEGNYNTDASVDVYVKGNVSATSTGTQDDGYSSAGVYGYSYHDSTIEVGGTVNAVSDGNRAYGVYVYKQPDDDSKNKIVIGNGISAKSDDNVAFGMAVYPGKKSEIVVSDGGVQASGTYAYGINIYDVNNKDNTYKNSQSVLVDVTGDVVATATNTAGEGVAVKLAQMDNDANVVVDGDIEGTTAGIYLKDNLGDVTISTSGTIKSENGAAIVAYVATDKNETTILPEITAWKIESGTDDLVVSDANTTNASDIQKSINYIIKSDVTEGGQTSGKGTITLTKLTGQDEGELAFGNANIGGTSYKTAHQDEIITIKVETINGYKYSLSAGQGILTNEGNNTYTLQVLPGGGVDLKAVLEKIVEQKHSSSDDSDSSSSGSSGAGSASGAASAGTTTIVGEPTTTTVTTASGTTATTVTGVTETGATVTTTTSGATTVTTTTDVTGATVVTATVELSSGKSVEVSGASVSTEGTLASGLVCSGPSPVVALTGESKTAGISAEAVAVINAIDSGNLAAVPVATEGKTVLAPSVALSGVTPGTQVQLVMDAGKIPATGTVEVLYYDKTTGAFVIITATVNKVTGIVTFNAPADGAAAIIG